MPHAYRYGAYSDGPDPLAPPYDAGRAVDALGERVLDGSGVREALRDLLRRGPDGRGGLDDLARQARRRRRELQRSGRLDGTLQRVRELLRTAVRAERSALAADPGQDAAWRRSVLDAVPDSPSQAVRELAGYDWRSDEARQAFDQIEDMLRRDVLDQQFAGLRQALSAPGDPGQRRRLTDMLADLDALLAARQRGEDTGGDFDRFMERHGDLFGEDPADRPADLDALVDELARRAAAAARLLESLTPAQRAELSALVADTLADLDLAAQMAALGDRLRALRPDLPWSGRARMDGPQGLSLPDATSALADLADLDRLDAALAQDYAGASLDDVDVEAVQRALGRRPADELRRLQEVERELRRQGYLVRAGDRLELTPKAMRRLGQTALRRVFASLSGSRRGDHDVRHAGSAGELTGASRPWEFGDEQPLDVVRTVANAVGRRLASRGADTRRLVAADFEVRETERRTRAAVALCVDQSFSMVVNDTWRDAKVTAMALHALATSQFPQDAVEVVAFADMARVLHPYELADLDANEVQGTNLQHALMLAGSFLDRHRDAEPVLLVVTDGEPTAHLDETGHGWFSWPPSQETLEATLAEVDRLTRRGVPISFFRLGDEPRLARFLDAVARRNGGRVLAPSADRLGDYVVTDYLARRRARTGSRR